MDNVEELGEEIASLSAHLDAAAHRLLECIRGFDEARGWHDQGAMSCAHWLSWRLGWDPATAREKVRVAHALGALPSIDEALRCARLSYAKVRALTRAATPDNETKLLQMALVATAAQLEQLCRGYRVVLDREMEPKAEERLVRRRLLPGGMVKLEMVLQPDEADLVLRAIERAREVSAKEAGAPRSGPQAGAPQTGTPQAGTPQANTPQAVPPGPEVEAVRVSAETLRRVACDCGLVAVGHDGEALNIGRRARGIPPAIRRALMLRDRGCAFPGCTHTAFLHAHHVEHWLHGGETRLENLVMLCTFHHHLVHEGGWTAEAEARPEADGSFVFTTPFGRRVAREPPREPVEDAPEWLSEWADARGLDLGPEVNMPHGEGKPADYANAMECLLAAGQ